MNCAICLDVIQNSCVGSCMHHYCYICLFKWCIRGHTDCPICRSFINEIKLDKEFDAINNPNTLSYEKIEPHIVMNNVLSKKITIKFDKTNLPGITLANRKGIGVVITFININNQCYKDGLRLNDIILFMNKVPCLHHKSCIEIINDAFNSEKSVVFDLLIK
jgi:hypothetical protein